MGESHHLTRAERKTLIEAARQVLDENQLGVQLIAGTGGNSTRETIELTKDAAEAGADSAMVITPGEQSVLWAAFKKPPDNLPLVASGPRSEIGRQLKSSGANAEL